MPPLQIVKTMPDKAVDAQSVVAFFKSVCIARAAANGPTRTSNKKGAPWDKMCAGCPGAGACTKTNPFYDYSGSIKCLNSCKPGNKCIVFTRHTMFTVDLNKDRSKYLLVCPGKWWSGYDRKFKLQWASNFFLAVCPLFI